MSGANSSSSIISLGKMRRAHKSFVAPSRHESGLFLLPGNVRSGASADRRLTKMYFAALC
jgi:hypothetical protein